MKTWFSGTSGDFSVVNRLAPLGTLVAVLLFAYELAGLTWMAVPAPETTAPNTGAALRPQAKKAEDGYTQLAALHLFGKPDTGEPQRSKPIDAPETKLNLGLHGVLYNPDPNGARAIIADGSGNEQSYRVGEPIPGGASLDKIYPDRVILLRNGRYETLKLPEKPLKSLPGPSLPAPSSGGTAGNGNQTAILQRYRRQMIAQPQLAGRYIQADPVQRNGRFLGFRVRPGADKGLFHAAGLHPGDIVTSVNGLPLNSADSGFRALDLLARSRNVVLRIRRNGREQTLHLRFQN